MKVEGKICVVTGGASGMGRSLAVLLATKHKASGVAICDVNAKDLEETARLAGATGTKITTAIVDVSNREQVEQWRDQVVKDFGGCDILFNNAGINANGKMVYDPEDNIEALEKGWDRCFNVDFYGVLYCTRAFLPVLISRPEAYLINTSSVNAFWTWGQHTAYTAAKHAVKGLTDSLMIELRVKAPHVKIATVHPGGIKTNIAKTTIDENNNNSNPSAAKLAKAFEENLADLTADEAAEWMIDGVKNNQYRMLVGYDAILFDKMVRFFPTRIYDFYEQVGKEGLSIDPMDPEQRNSKLIGPGVFARVLAAGLWSNLMFMWPMIFLKMRHTAAGRGMLYTLGAGVGYKLLSHIAGRPGSKL